jgi:hypothetical protein
MVEHAICVEFAVSLCESACQISLCCFWIDAPWRIYVLGSGSFV